MSKIHLDTAGVFAWAVVIILLSVGFEWVMLKLVEKFWNWEPDCSKLQSKKKKGNIEPEKKKKTLCVE